MQANRKKISQSKLLEAVEIMLFEAIASHSRILENARSQAEAVMNDDSLMDSVIDDLAEVGKSIKRISSVLKDLSDKSNNANTVNLLSTLIYGQFTSYPFSNPKGVILNGYRERFCMKLMLAKLNNILKKRRLSGLFDSGNCLLRAISSGIIENGDIMYCLYSPIEALNVKDALRYQNITMKCYWKWRSTVRDAMLSDGSPSIPLKQYFGFYAVDA